MRILTRMDVIGARDGRARSRQIVLHWQPLDDLAGAYTETLRFDEANERFQRARQFYENLQEEASAAVAEPFWDVAKDYPEQGRAERLAFIAAFQRQIALKTAMKRLEMIFTGERPPPPRNSKAD